MKEVFFVSAQPIVGWAIGERRRLIPSGDYAKIVRDMTIIYSSNPVDGGAIAVDEEGICWRVYPLDFDDPDRKDYDAVAYPTDPTDPEDFEKKCNFILGGLK